MAREEKRRGNFQYNWDQLVGHIKKIRSEYDRAVKSRYQGRPLVLTKKQYSENNKIIARGLIRWGNVSGETSSSDGYAMAIIKSYLLAKISI